MENSIGKRIHKKRIEAELTQEKFAELTHVSKWTVINWEADKRVPLATTLREIAVALRTTLDYLLYGEKEKTILADDYDTHGGQGNNISFSSLLALPVYRMNDLHARPISSFAVIAEDPSMCGIGIPYNSKVIVSPEEPAGDMDIALVNYRGAVALRKVCFLMDGSVNLMSSDGINFTIPPEENKPDIFSIYGKAIWVLSHPRHGL